MDFPIELAVLCFAAGSVIHAAYVILAAKMKGHAGECDPASMRDGIYIGVTTFFWQFGNLLMFLGRSLGFTQDTLGYRISFFIREAALICFPLLFSYMSLHAPPEALKTNIMSRVGAWLRYPLWVWTVAGVAVIGARAAGIDAPILSMDVLSFTTLHLMLLYFIVFTVSTAGYRKRAEATGVGSLIRAQKAAVIAGAVAAGTFVLMLGGYWNLGIPFLPYVELAAMMTSVPFVISVAYRLYQFPFMDAFIREVIAGVILVAVFAAAMSVSQFPLWIMAAAVLLAYSKAPLTRWVERTFIGYEESVDEQEERIGTAIRALTRLDEFPARVSEILAREVEAEWVEFGSSPRADAVHQVEIPGSGLWLSVGLRIGRRRYMSRQLRIVRTAALQLSAHHHQLSRHEMREVTARAQMRALQAQINPHFLFNTLNVLANLIHSNPPKAERVTEELAEVFRYALESTRAEWVKLGDELQFLGSYLGIEKARFEERLTYSFDVDEALHAMRIPPMILQPLVENAVKHGIGPRLEGGTIRILGRLEEDRVVIAVEDSGAGHRSASRQRGAGIGLANVRERLHHLYGEAGTLRLDEMSPEGTRAVLTLPQAVGVHS